MDEDSSSAREETKALPPPVPIRLVAFLMDFILLSFIGALIAFYLPSLLGVENEFNHLISRLAELWGKKALDPGEVQRWQNDYNLLQDKINFNFYLTLSLTLTFVLYFLLGELFCKGKSIGKATFSLMTVNADEGSPPSFRQILIRSLLKGLSINIFWLGLANLLFWIFNRDKKCLHDLASGTITVRSNPPSQDITTNTQKS
jgi:uncharacterized RDD family membrane protein YckC